jgi:hypothetical protein
MPDRDDSNPRGNEDSQESAQRIADELSPLLRRARASGFDFLAYLLGMALKEARRLSQE